MKTTAQHIHPDETVCWYDSGAWWTQLPEDFVDPYFGPGHPDYRFATQNVLCPNEVEDGLVEIGSRFEPLVAGDAPHSPTPSGDQVIHP